MKKIKGIMCSVVGHKWGKWINLDGAESVRQCLRCLKLDTDCLAFFDDDIDG